MTTYSDPPQDAVDLLNEVLNEQPDHAPLVAAGVTIALRFATAAERQDGTITFPLKLHGIRALAIAKIRPYQLRTEGLSDAKIDIDSGWWREAEREERKAVLDHECLHFEVIYNDDGGIETDDCGRTKLKTRHHDADFGWFFAIARRHGVASVECRQMATLVEDAGQWLLPGMYDPETKLLVPTAGQLLKAMDKHLADKPAVKQDTRERSVQSPSNITSMTFNSPGSQSVTIDSTDAKAIRAAAIAMSGGKLR